MLGRARGQYWLLFAVIVACIALNETGYGAADGQGKGTVNQLIDVAMAIKKLGRRVFSARECSGLDHASL